MILFYMYIFLFLGSAPNLLHFIPPHLMIQSQHVLRDNTKSLSHQGFAADNGILRSLHQHRSNVGYRTPFQVRLQTVAKIVNGTIFMWAVFLPYFIASNLCVLCWDKNGSFTCSKQVGCTITCHVCIQVQVTASYQL